MARLLDSTRSTRSTRLKNRDTFAAVDLLGHHLGLAQFTSHIAICDVTSFWKGSTLIPSTLLPSCCVFCCIISPVAYHRIYINAVVVSRGGFAAVFACLKPHFPAAKIHWRPVPEVGQAGVPRSPRTDAFAQCVVACRNCRQKGEQTAEGVGRVLLRRLSVKGFPQGEPLCAEAHGAVPQQEEPAVLPT